MTLTPGRLARAERRLAELPAAHATVGSTIRPDGTVDLGVLVNEGPIFPRGLFGLSAFVGRAVVEDDLQVPIKNAAGLGEAITTAFRFPSPRRRLQVDVAGPSPGFLSGLADVRGFWERQTYRAAGVADAGTIESTHDSLAVGLDDWIGGRIRWQGAALFDRWNDMNHAGGRVGIDVRGAGDRISIAMIASGWTPNLGTGAFGQFVVRTAWRSTARETGASWSALLESTTATEGAPVDLWSGAGTGQGRAPLLRAHPLLHDNILDGPVFGRTLAHTTVEYQHPAAMVHRTILRWAGFVDAAEAWHRLDGTTSPRFVDVGLGVRWTAPGLGGVVRLDLAHPAGAGGGFVGSAGWQAAWPRQ